MDVVFRVDASIEMGIGHVMRCLTLADALKSKGSQCHFVCREQPGNLMNQIVNRGHQVYPLPHCPISHQVDDAPTENLRPPHAHWLGCCWLTDARQTLNSIGSLNVSWLVVDHYAIDQRWEKQMRSYCNRIMVIDDLADRYHDCDLLLDQTFGRSEQEYEKLVTVGCIRLTGSKYSLLRPEFAALRDYSLQRRKNPKLGHLLISMGGVDKDNATGRVLKALSEASLPEPCRITIVMGESAPWLDEVKAYAEAMSRQAEVRTNVKDMAQLMANSDLAIGAAGSTSWERCCIGLPALMVVLAENQQFIAKGLNETGAAVNIGRVTSAYFCKRIEQALLNINSSSDILKKMSTAAIAVTSGNGATLVTDKLSERGLK